MTTTREKTGFDCVKTTREIRDRLSVELAGMSREDRVQWLNSRDFSDPLLRRLANRRRPREGRGGESAPARSTGRITYSDRSVGGGAGSRVHAIE